MHYNRARYFDWRLYIEFGVCLWQVTMAALNFLNSSSLDKGNHDRDAVRISDLDFDGFLRFCFTVSSLTFSFDREDRVWSHFQALRSSSKILRWASSFQLTLSVIFKFAQTWSFVFDVLSKLFFSSSRTGCANFSLKSSTTEVAWQKNIKHFNNKPI